MKVEPFPARPLRLILGASAGSASDIVARALAPALATRLGQPVTIEPHPGESGVSGARLAAGSPADGHTLFMATLGIQAIGPNLESPPPYDALNDFSPVSLVARCPLLLAIHPSIAARSVDELILLALSKPGSLTFASSAIGGAPHLAGELFMKLAGVDLTHVRYERTQQLYADLVEGRISLSFNNIMSMLPQLAAGRLRGLAVTGAMRSGVVPQLPTVSEAGLRGYEVTNWLGIVVPARVDPEIVAKLNGAIVGALGSGGVSEGLAASGMEIVGGSAREFARHIRSELARWAPVVRAWGARGANAVKSASSDSNLE